MTRTYHFATKGEADSFARRALKAGEVSVIDFDVLTYPATAAGLAEALDDLVHLLAANEG